MLQFLGKRSFNVLFGSSDICSALWTCCIAYYLWTNGPLAFDWRVTRGDSIEPLLLLDSIRGLLNSFDLSIYLSIQSWTIIDFLSSGAKLWWADDNLAQLGTVSKRGGLDMVVLRNKTTGIVHMKMYDEDSQTGSVMSRTATQCFYSDNVLPPCKALLCAFD